MASAFCCSFYSFSTLTVVRMEWGELFIFFQTLLDGNISSVSFRNEKPLHNPYLNAPVAITIMIHFFRYPSSPFLSL